MKLDGPGFSPDYESSDILACMSYDKSKHLTRVATFRSLHESGCFVLPNPWDAGSARYLEHLGFKALATTSAGFAYSKGLPDDASVVSRELVLDHCADISDATSLPVNADFQNGYADEPEGVAENVKLCVATGVAGLSIEDSTTRSEERLYPESLAVERVKAARKAIDQSGVPVVLTARCEAWLVKNDDARNIALKRLVAFAEAGADCLFAPGVSEPGDIADIVKAVAPKPVNVLVWHPGLTVAQVADLGVRRISVGSALARVGWEAFIRAAKSLLNDGNFEKFEQPSALTNLNQIFRSPR